MSTKPKQPTTSVQAEIHVTINGQLHKLTKAEAIKLRDSLDDAIGDAKPFPVYIPRQYDPPPYRTYPFPWGDKVTCGDTTAQFPLHWRADKTCGDTTAQFRAALQLQQS